MRWFPSPKFPKKFPRKRRYPTASLSSARGAGSHGNRPRTATEAKASSPGVQGRRFHGSAQYPGRRHAATRAARQPWRSRVASRVRGYFWGYISKPKCLYPLLAWHIHHNSSDAAPPNSALVARTPHDASLRGFLLPPKRMHPSPSEKAPSHGRAGRNATGIPATGGDGCPAAPAQSSIAPGGGRPGCRSAGRVVAPALTHTGRCAA